MQLRWRGGEKITVGPNLATISRSASSNNCISISSTRQGSSILFAISFFVVINAILVCKDARDKKRRSRPPSGVRPSIPVVKFASFFVADLKPFRIFGQDLAYISRRGESRGLYVGSRFSRRN